MAGPACAAVIAGLTTLFWPIHAMTGSLWYTDAAANAALGLALMLSLPPVGSRETTTAPWLSALAGVLAVLCRQTNAVWLVTIAVGAAARRTHASEGASRVPASGSALSHGGHDAAAAKGDMDEFDSADVEPLSIRCMSHPVSVVSLAAFVLSRTASCWRELLAYGAALALFAGFVAVNGAIVVGDRAHHEVAVHAAQPGYALAVVLPLLLPACLLPDTVRLGWEFLTGRCFTCTATNALERLERLGALAAGAPASPTSDSQTPIRGARVCAGGTRWLVLVMLCVGAGLAAGFGTVEHPFLLADNRHYTFYAWRYTLQHRTWLRFTVGPVYIAAAGAVGAAVVAGGATGRAGSSAGLADVLLLCTAVAVGLTPLLEPRYWTPVVLLVLGQMPYPSSLQSPRGWAHLAVVSSLMLVYVVVTYVFLMRPYQWGDGSIARFMW